MFMGMEQVDDAELHLFADEIQIETICFHCCTSEKKRLQEPHVNAGRGVSIFFPSLILSTRSYYDKEKESKSHALPLLSLIF